LDYMVTYPYTHYDYIDVHLRVPEPTACVLIVRTDLGASEAKRCAMLVWSRGRGSDGKAWLRERDGGVSPYSGIETEAMDGYCGQCFPDPAVLFEDFPDSACSACGGAGTGKEYPSEEWMTSAYKEDFWVWEAA
jgi:hypothetical protein